MTKKNTACWMTPNTHNPMFVVVLEIYHFEIDVENTLDDTQELELMEG